MENPKQEGPSSPVFEQPGDTEQSGTTVIRMPEKPGTERGKEAETNEIRVDVDEDAPVRPWRKEA